MSTSSAKTTPAAVAGKPIAARSLAHMRRAPTHPGEIFVEDFLEGGTFWKQAAAARALGWAGSRLNEFIKGRRELSYRELVELADYTSTTPEFWATLQTNHYLWHAIQARKAAKKAS